MRQRFVGVLLLLSSLLWTTAPGAAAPPKVTLELKADTEAAPRDGSLALDIYAHIATGWHINAHKPDRPYLIPTELTLILPPGIAGEDIHYPPPARKTFAFAGGSALLVYKGTLGLATVLRVPRWVSQIRVEAVLRYQACNDTTCLPPTLARAVLDIPFDAALTGDQEGAAGSIDTGASGNDVRVARWLSERGLGFTLLGVFLLGLGLNLTPCVYPLISVTLAYFGGQAGGQGRVGMLAGLYVLGIALSFSALGSAAALSGGVFGAALQQPAVVLFIVGVLALLALSSFGFYQFRPPAALMRWAGRAGAGGGGALFMGLTMGVVAAPCVGPMVLGLLVFVGSRQEPFLGFLLFFTLALGMGAPYLLLAMAAGSIQRLPWSGEWMLWTERLFGCVLLSMAAYFLAPILSPPFREWLLPAVIGLSGIYLGFVESAGHSVRYFPPLKRVAGVAMVAFAIWVGGPTTVTGAIAWESLQALSTNGHGPDQPRPVLVDFAAEWCIPCREMDHTTYAHPEVVREAERFRMVKADITEENETTTALVNKYDVRGVPTVILFSAGGAEEKRLVGYIGPGELLTAMREVR